MSDVDTLITVVGFVAVMATFIGLFTAHERRHTKAEKSLEELDKRVKKAETFMENLAAAVLDALEAHVLPERGGDGAVMELLVTKREAREGEDHGALFTVIDFAHS